MESAADEATAKRILNRLLAKVEGLEHARTRATLGAARDSWLRVHEVEENTRQGVRGLRPEAHQAGARPCARRQGHGVYAGWVSESDRRAAGILGSRVSRPPRPSAP